jgi:serine/threonine protein kinase
MFGRYSKKSRKKSTSAESLELRELHAQDKKTREDKKPVARQVKAIITASRKIPEFESAFSLIDDSNIDARATVRLCKDNDTEELKIAKYVWENNVEDVNRERSITIKINNLLSFNPHVAKCDEYISGDNIIWVTDYFPSLYTILIKRQRYYKTIGILNCIISIMKAVKSLHDIGILHLDIKLENILRKSNNDPADIVLIDFGLAVSVSDAKLLDTIRGTPGYIAPEVIRNRNYSEKADVWACGVVLYELLSAPLKREEPNMLQPFSYHFGFNSYKIAEILQTHKGRGTYDMCIQFHTSDINDDFNTPPTCENNLTNKYLTQVFDTCINSNIETPYEVQEVVDLLENELSLKCTIKHYCTGQLNLDCNCECKDERHLLFPDYPNPPSELCKLVNSLLMPNPDDRATLDDAIKNAHKLLRVILGQQRRRSSRDKSPQECKIDTPLGRCLRRPPGTTPKAGKTDRYAAGRNIQDYLKGMRRPIINGERPPLFSHMKDETL